MAAGDMGKSLPSLLRLLPLFRESETASEALHDDGPQSDHNEVC